MSKRQILVLWMCSAQSALAESPQESARRAMEASVARQLEAVSSMRPSIEKQGAALANAAPESRGASQPFFTLSWPAPGPGCESLSDAELDPLLDRASQKESVDESLLRAVASQESGFRPCAVSPKGAMGLMQLMPATAQDLGVVDPFDPAESLLGGARLLKQLLARFGGNRALALGAYNAGPTRVEEAGGVPDISETKGYVGRILAKLPLP